MKKSLLACSILLAAAGCAAEKGELEEVRAEALASQANLIDQVFISSLNYAYFVWELDPATNEYVQREIRTKARLSFIRAENYDLDGAYHEQAGNANGLDYEVVVEHVDETTGKTYSSDMSFFARKNEAGSYDFFDCNSTRNCQTDFMTKMEIRDTAEGKKLNIKNQNISLVDSHQAEIEFVAVR